MRSGRRLSLALQLIACVSHAKVNWNLESTFLMHLQQKANSQETAPDTQSIGE